MKKIVRANGKLQTEIRMTHAVKDRPTEKAREHFRRKAYTKHEKCKEEHTEGEWMLEVEKEPNCHWSVKAQCSNCSYEKGEIWGGNFPDIPAYLALELSLIHAKEVKMSNFCPDCGADMRKKV